jgi:hypothetical protein
MPAYAIAIACQIIDQNLNKVFTHTTAAVRSAVSKLEAEGIAYHLMYELYPTEDGYMGHCFSIIKIEYK